MADSFFQDVNLAGTSTTEAVVAARSTSDSVRSVLYAQFEAALNQERSSVHSKPLVVWAASGMSDRSSSSPVPTSRNRLFDLLRDSK
jgi:hypothetical protein